MGFYAFLKKEALDLLFPYSCAGCGVLGVILCVTCRARMKIISPSCFGCGKLMPGKKRVPPGRTCKSCRKNSNIYAFVSPFSYSNHAARELVHYLKYRRVRETAGVISEILDEHLNHFGIKFYKDTFIIPVPLHKSRERTRGFNQAELIAKKLDSMNLKKMVLTGVLLRHKNTRSQIDLTREEKETNVGGAFMVLNPGLISGKTAILVDDVKTTGATIEEAARILKDAGAKRIWAITVAH